MKIIICAILMATVLGTPAFAAKVYLKEGGFIQAKKVWREGGTVHVLVNRDILTTFEVSEVNMKRTFVKKPRLVKKVAAEVPLNAVLPQNKEATPNEASAVQKPEEKKKGIALPKLPSLPKLSEKSPDSLVPSSGSGGTIKQNKKEMSEKLGEASQ
jgi:hypothetical protein